MEVDALRVRQNIQLSQTIPWPGKLDLRKERMEADAALHVYSASRVDLIAETLSTLAQWWSYMVMLMRIPLTKSRLSWYTERPMQR